MPALVAGIHVFTCYRAGGCAPGRRPVMTKQTATPVITGRTTRPGNDEAEAERSRISLRTVKRRAIRPPRHARARRGHPRLALRDASRSLMVGANTCPAPNLK